MYEVGTDPVRETIDALHVAARKASAALADAGVTVHVEVLEVPAATFDTFDGELDDYPGWQERRLEQNERLTVVVSRSLRADADRERISKTA